MNHQNVDILVTSSDGIQFALKTSRTAVAYELAFAKSKTSAELAAHGDFHQVKSLDDLLAPDEYVFPQHDIRGPLERRAAFTVIKGGKQS